LAEASTWTLERRSPSSLVRYRSDLKTWKKQPTRDAALTEYVEVGEVAAADPSSSDDGVVMHSREEKTDGIYNTIQYKTNLFGRRRMSLSESEAPRVHINTYLLRTISGRRILTRAASLFRHRSRRRINSSDLDPDLSMLFGTT